MRTPLLKAARHNATTLILELLLEKGAKPDKADIEGNTPLHYCAMRGIIKLNINDKLRHQRSRSFPYEIMKKGNANPYAINKSFFVPYEVCSREDVRKDFIVCPVCLKPGEIKCKSCSVVVYCNTTC